MEAKTHDIVVDPFVVEPAGFPTVDDGPPIERRVPLSGWFERQGFHPLLAAFLLFVVSFVLFQGLATVIALIVVIGQGGIVTEAGDLLEILESATGALLVGNTVGQFLGMAAPVLLWTLLHTNRPAGFLRVSTPDWSLLGLSAFALAGLLPIIQWLGEVNSTLPLPDVLVELERAQMELIERILASEITLAASLFALAVTPAICEELLFRGYLQRQFERSLGVAGGIIGTGILFGLYHFRLSQAAPLIVLGIFLGWLAWRTGSLWVPVVIHFMNNAFAVAATRLAAANPDWGIEDVEHIPMPPYVILGGVIILAGAVVLINRRVALIADSARPETRPGTSDQRPATSDRRPETKPETRDQRPETRPETRDQRPETKPETRDQRPETRPETSDQRPETKPETSDQRPETRPETSDQRPETKPETNKNG